MSYVTFCTENLERKENAIKSAIQDDGYIKALEQTIDDIYLKYKILSGIGIPKMYKGVNADVANKIIRLRANIQLRAFEIRRAFE